MRRILVIDNYDSFTYNLVHYLRNLTEESIDIFRNDEITIEEIKKYDKILMSPGPGIPVEAGICLDMVREYAKSKSIMGVCLGHQAIGEAFGGKIINLDHVYHGVATLIHIIIDKDPLYEEIPKKLNVGRYHSWVIDRKTLPECFSITCEDEKGMIMGISHNTFDLKGVQYHPESVLTEHGMKIMENWLKT